MYSWDIQTYFAAFGLYVFEAALILGMGLRGAFGV